MNRHRNSLLPTHNRRSATKSSALQQGDNRNRSVVASRKKEFVRTWNYTLCGQTQICYGQPMARKPRWLSSYGTQQRTQLGLIEGAQVGLPAFPLDLHCLLCERWVRHPIHKMVPPSPHIRSYHISFQMCLFTFFQITTEP